MKASQITVGGQYLAKISGRVVTVRVDDIRVVNLRTDGRRWRFSYDVTNLATLRKTTFRSPQKFRGVAPLAPERIEP